MSNITLPNQHVNQFYIEYYNLKILVHEHIITKCVFFDNLIHFNKHQNIYFDINNNLNIEETVDDFIKTYNQKEYTKDIIEKILRCIVDTIYEIKTDINLIYESNYNTKNITIFIDMLDLFQIERKSLQKLVTHNINILCQLMDIKILPNENKESDSEILDTISYLLESSNKSQSGSMERCQYIINLYIYILKHIDFIKQENTVSLLATMVKKLKEHNKVIINNPLASVEHIILFSIFKKLIKDIWYNN